VADFTITISNSLQCFALEQATLWNDAIWGTDYWGYGSNTVALSTEKFLANGLTVDEILVVQAFVNVTISNSLTMSSETTSEEIFDSAGYNYVFVKPTVDAENRNLGSFTEVGPNSTTWAAASATTTTWSDE